MLTNRFRISIRIRSTAWRINALYKRSTHRHTDTRQVLHRVDAQRRRDVREMPTRTEELGNLCNGQHLPECRWKTPCMPDGLIPDIQIEDDPIQAYQIGDVNEPLLKQALMEAGRHTKPTV